MLFKQNKSEPIFINVSVFTHLAHRDDKMSHVLLMPGVLKNL